LTAGPRRDSLTAVRAHAPLRPAARRALWLALALAVAGCQGLSPIPKPPAPSDAERARFVRLRLEDARAFQAQGRLDSAAAAVRRALAVAPDEPRALRQLAEVVAAQGDAEEAARLRARADEVDPPPPPPPDTALVPVATGILAVLVPPERADDALGTAALAAEWPDRAVPAALAARLRTRLPKAGVTEISPATVAQARAWLRERDARLVLSLRVLRASCGTSVKDGPFALAQLVAAIGTPEAVVLPPTAVGKDYPYHGDWFGPTPSGTGLFASLGGYLGLTVGWVEGLEINFLGAVVGLDVRRPALKLPGVGRLGMTAGI